MKRSRDTVRGSAFCFKEAILIKISCFFCGIKSIYCNFAAMLNKIFKMNRIIGFASLLVMLTISMATVAAPADSLAADSAIAAEPLSPSDSATLALGDIPDEPESGGFQQELKTKFIEGNAGFMSLVALALVIGLAFCIERIIFLSLSEIDAKKFMADVDGKLDQGDVEGAKQICRETRGPVASICYQGVSRIDDSTEEIERSIQSYGSVQAGNLEKGCSWIKLFIAMAPSLGFLGTVIGMVMAFDQIEMAGDISPTIVAAGMKVALITTIFGIIVALILQVFYRFILSKIEHITAQMEESAVTLMDSINKFKRECQ